MALLTGEQALFTNKNLIITNYRVRCENDNKFCSILIKNVSSTSITSTNYPYWIVAAIACFLSPVFLQGLMNSETFFVVVFLGVLFIAAYFYTIKKTIVISSKGGDSIRYEGDYRQSEAIADMIEKIQLDLK